MEIEIMGLFSSIGKLTNDWSGSTSAAKLNQKYALQQMNLSYKQQKEFAQNAHQWETEDLKKAGLNPVLSSGGSGASAGGAGGTASGAGATASGGTISDITNSATSLLKLGKELNLLDAQEKQAQTQAIKNAEEAGVIKPEANARIKNIISQSLYNSAKTTSEKGNPKYWAGKGIEKGSESAKSTWEKTKEKYKNDPNQKKYKKAKTPKEAWNNIIGI